MILVHSRRPIPHPIHQPHVQRVHGGEWGRALVLVLVLILILINAGTTNTSTSTLILVLVLVYGLGVVQLGWVGAQALNLMCRGPSAGSGVGVRDLEQGTVHIRAICTTPTSSVHSYPCTIPSCSACTPSRYLH